MHLGGGSGLNLFANEGNITGNVEKGNFHFAAKDGTFEAKIKDAIKFLSESGAMHMIAQEAANIIAKNGAISIHAQSGDIHSKAGGSMHKDAGQNIYMQSGTSNPGSGQNAQNNQGNAKQAYQTTPVSSDDTSKLA
jgi:hypothetical protein